jgi:DNA-directed RNA polymerase subunit beta'
VRRRKALSAPSVDATISKATVEIRHHNVVKNSAGVTIIMGATRRLVHSRCKKVRRQGNLPRSHTAHACFIEDGVKVKAGDKMAEWDPYTIPVITEKDGVAHYFDMVEGLSDRRKMDEATGISSKPSLSTGVHSRREVI